MRHDLHHIMRHAAYDMPEPDRLGLLSGATSTYTRLYCPILRPPDNAAPMSQNSDPLIESNWPSSARDHGADTCKVRKGSQDVFLSSPAACN